MAAFGQLDSKKLKFIYVKLTAEKGALFEGEVILTSEIDVVVESNIAEPSF